MVFISKIDRFERKISKKNIHLVDGSSCSGSSIGTTYEYRIIDGIKQLVPVGKVNYQDKIDSFADVMDINNQIARFLAGDDSVMNPIDGNYGDFTNMPTSYAELFQRVNDCNNLFNALPADIRSKFDNSSDRFWSEFGSEYFNGVFDSFNGLSAESDSVDVAPVSEVLDKEVSNA